MQVTIASEEHPVNRSQLDNSLQRRYSNSVCWNQLEPKAGNCRVNMSCMHHIRPGKEAVFEEGPLRTMGMPKETPGVIGYQMIKRNSEGDLAPGLAFQG
jgi:hypothetical protein